jgi:hypothetical protein
VNLIAFVGRKIEVRYIEPKPKPNEWVLDAEFLLRYEVIEVVFGSYPGKEMTFTSHVHVGEPEFNKHKFGLLYVSEYEGRLFHQIHRELAKQLPESSVRPGFHILSGSRVVVRPAASSTRASSANAFPTPLGFPLL